MERYECKIHGLTLAKRKVFDKLFQHHDRQLVQDDGARAMSPESKFAKELAIIKGAAEDKADMAANLTTAKRVQFQFRISNGETEATTWNLADQERVTNQLKRVIYGIP